MVDSPTQVTERARKLAPYEYTLLELGHRQALRVTDLVGGQQAHLVCVNAGDVRDRFSASNTMLLNKGVYFTTGSTLYSSFCHPMMTIIDDSAGAHDALPSAWPAGAPETELARMRDSAARARRNLASALAQVELRPHQAPDPLNLFVRHGIDEDGTLSPAVSVSMPGDAVALRAELDLIVVVSSVPLARSTEPWPLEIGVEDTEGPE